MRHLVTLTVIGMSLLATVACNSGKKTERINRAGKVGEKSKGQYGAFMQEATKNNKECLNLKTFTAAARTQSPNFLVYTQDVNLLEYDANACKFVESTQGVDQARALLAVKESGLHSHTYESLKKTFNFMQAKTQTACDSVLFDGDVTFSAACTKKEVNPEKLFVVNEDRTEYRLYEVDSTGLSVTVYTAATQVEECKSTINPNQALFKAVKTKFQAGDSVSSVRVQTAYLKALKKALKPVPPSIDALLKGAEKTEKDKTTTEPEVSLIFMSLHNVFEQADLKNVCAATAVPSQPSEK